MVGLQAMVGEKGDQKDYRDGTFMEGVIETCIFRISRILAKGQVLT
jgi:hypothetical protein